MLEVVGLVDLHYVVGALLFFVAVMGVLAGHLRHHLLLQVSWLWGNVLRTVSLMFTYTDMYYTYSDCLRECSVIAICCFKVRCLGRCDSDHENCR